MKKEIYVNRELAEPESTFIRRISSKVFDDERVLDYTLRCVGASPEINQAKLIVEE